jgi:hypothetical protein
MPKIGCSGRDSIYFEIRPVLNQSDDPPSLQVTISEENLVEVNTTYQVKGLQESLSTPPEIKSGTQTLKPAMNEFSVE